MFTPRNAFAVIGTVLALVALFLVLDKGDAARQLVGTFGRQSNNILRTLQGR